MKALSNVEPFKDFFYQAFPKSKFGTDPGNELFMNFNDYSINNINRIAMILAQLAHESANFSVTTENLNYSANALTAVFPKYFNNINANEYARKPEKIANRVYANRMGNGDEASGDGWKYRGRGFIQLTGKDNYAAFAKYMDDPSILENPDQAAECHYAVMSALWFWKKNNLVKYEDDVRKVTKIINGGYNGLDDRQKLFSKITKMITEGQYLV